jgi:hypothetical protein
LRVKRRRRGIFVASKTKKFQAPSGVASTGYAAPTGLEILLGRGFYKDLAPTALGFCFWKTFSMLIASKNAGRLSAGFLSANANNASSGVGFIGVLWGLCSVANFGGLLKFGQFLFPLGGWGGFAPGVVKLHQPFEGFRDPARGVEIGRQAGLACWSPWQLWSRSGSASA